MKKKNRVPYKMPEIVIRNYKVPKVIVERYAVPEIVTFVITKCPYCGVYVQTNYQENGEFGEGWYCPTCRSKVIPRMEKVKVLEADEEVGDD